MKGLIFDMDGLMIDSEGLYFETERALGKRLGREVNDDLLFRMMGQKPLHSMEIFREALQIPHPAEELLEWRDSTMLERMKQELPAMPGLHEILNRFHGRLSLAIATGNILPFLDLTLDTLRIRPFFKVLQTSEEVERGKPDPAIYHLAVRKLGYAPEECAVLEDSHNGALAAHRAGCYVIAVPSEYTAGQDFSFAHQICSNLFEAAHHLETLLPSPS